MSTCWFHFGRPLSNTAAETPCLEQSTSIICPKQPLGDSKQNIKQTKVQRSRNIKWILQPLAFDTIFQQFWHCAIRHNFPTILTLCNPKLRQPKKYEVQLWSCERGQLAADQDLKHYFDTTMFVDLRQLNFTFGHRLRKKEKSRQRMPRHDLDFVIFEEVSISM